MTWSLKNPQGFESAKIKYEVLPYLSTGGLDIGCGPEKVWPHLIGIDSQKDTSLFGIQMKPDIVLKNAAKLGMFADGAIENVFSAHLLEHITDHVAALREWWRVLKVGGHLILYLPHRDLYPQIGQPGSNPDHKHDFKNSDIVDVMELVAPDWTLLENQTREEGMEYSFLQVWRKEAEGAGQNDASMNKTPKTAAIVRVGGNGDALWAASVAAHLHADGYSVTAFMSANGEEVLRHDPHIDRIITVPQGLLGDEELLEYWAWQAPKFDKWVNLIGSVEGRLLPHQSVHEFYLPQHLRHELMNRNYLDMVHAYAELPAGTPSLQKFYPTEAEIAWAQKMRAEMPGPMVLLSPTGSGPFKAWPHAQDFMERMADAGVYTVMVGDLKHLPDLDIVSRHGTDYGHVVGMEWPLRLALAMVLQADAVVATESVFANAAAFEPMPKVVMLSHSSNENLARDWRNCITLEAPVACHPCHRIHNEAAVLCTKDKNTGAAACMAYYSADLVSGLVLKSLGIEQREAA
jgi:predicted SAM-dependent methyltransferase/ADP-heptose:LPS heptosyltransferase